MTAATAAALADEWETSLRNNIRNLLEHPAVPGCARLWVDAAVEAAMAGGRSDSGVPTWVDDALQARGDRVYREVQFAGGDAALLKLWRQHRIAYDLDPDLQAELGRTRLAGEIPFSAFMHLPHPDPFVALPTPLVLPLEGDLEQRVTGFFVTGRRTHALEVIVGTGPGWDPADLPDHDLAGARYLQCSTHAEGADALGITFMSAIYGSGGRRRYVNSGEPDAIYTRVTLRPGQTVRSMIAQVALNFKPLDGLEANWRGYLDTLVNTAVNTLAYLSAENAEIEPVTGRARQAVAKAVRPGAKVPKVYGVGYREGSVIRKYRRAYTRPAGPGQPTGVTMPPHIRAAHFQNFRVGPGRPNERTETRLRWVNFTKVNMRDNAPASTTTIRRVK
jgi:hypothetical protein